jgi:uncharacterized membrane protein
MRILTALALAAAFTAAVAPTAGADPVASASKSCSVGDERSYGTTYVISISVSGTSCRSGRSLIRSFHDCRPGKSGKCPSVKGYSCSERREKGPTQYDSRVTCRKGSKTVKHTYTQFT